MNYIIFPGAKYFVLPCLMIKSFYESMGESCYIVLVDKQRDYFNIYGVDKSFLLTECQIHFSEGNNYIFFHHGTESIIKRAELFINKIPIDISYTVSFMPDALGNAMHGKSYLEVINNIKKRNEKHKVIKDIFSFGFIHSTTLNKFEDEEIINLSYDYMMKIFDDLKENDLVGKDLKSAIKSKNIIFIPYRPWCTKKFHGGVYDFGSPEELAEIYNKLIESILKENNYEECQIIYRGDSRFKKESQVVFDKIDHLNKVSIDKLMSDKITLEPFIYYLMKIIDADSNLWFLTLDSTTFQAVPFLNKEKNNGNIYSLFGCPSEYLREIDGGFDFNAKKLRGKINDFYNRYKLFLENDLVTEVEKIEDGFLKVRI